MAGTWNEPNVVTPPSLEQSVLGWKNETQIRGVDVPSTNRGELSPLPEVSLARPAYQILDLLTSPEVDESTIAYQYHELKDEELDRKKIEKTYHEFLNRPSLDIERIKLVRKFIGDEFDKNEKKEAYKFLWSLQDEWYKMHPQVSVPSPLPHEEKVKG
ncbi:MAG TPA: hypothetical protein VLH19_01690 [Patescibacteria group bacterium]|nr:hypothetical protein [Patescibacteria group bacterium]